MKEEFLAAENLNIGFIYPEEYKKFLNSWKKLYDTPWWLIGTSKGFFKSYYEFINVERGSNCLFLLQRVMRLIFLLVLMYFIKYGFADWKMMILPMWIGITVILCPIFLPG